MEDEGDDSMEKPCIDHCVRRKQYGSYYYHYVRAIEY